MKQLKAAKHELRCRECRVTWMSWAQRLLGLKCGYTPKLPKRQRALAERARRAEAAVERVRELAAHAEMTADVIDPTGERIQFAAVAVRDLRAALDQPEETL